MYSTMTAQIKSSKAFFRIYATSFPPRTEGGKEELTVCPGKQAFPYDKYITQAQKPVNLRLTLPGQPLFV